MTNLTNSNISQLQSEARPLPLLKDFFFVCLMFLLFSRLLSESVNSFVWEKANQVWSIGMIGMICIVFLPLLVIATRREKNIFLDYLPIFVLFLYLSTRVDYRDTYSIKCILSEFINWFAFIFTAETCARNENTKTALKKVIIFTTKVIVVISLVQLITHIAITKQINPFGLIEERPVRGIYVHQSICLIMLFPFSYYFLKKRSYLWLFLIMVASLFTGSRSSFLSFFLLFILIYKSYMSKEIRLADLLATISIIVLVYGFLIYQNLKDSF